MKTATAGDNLDEGLAGRSATFDPDEGLADIVDALDEIPRA